MFPNKVIFIKFIPIPVSVIGWLLDIETTVIMFSFSCCPFKELQKLEFPSLK